MNSKGTKKEPLTQTRGFYIALYGCLAALLALAIAISYSNYTAVQRAKELRAQTEIEAQQASANTVRSYLTPEDRSEAATPSATPRPVTTPTAPAASKPATGTGSPPAGSAPATGSPPASGAGSTQAAPPAAAPSSPAGSPATGSPTTGTAPAADKPATGKPATETEGEQSAAPESGGTAIKPPPIAGASELSPPTFETFTEGDTLNWPVLGEVVMDYSGSKMIYDRTLEHYRTNDVLCIATEVGTPVHAAAAGVVKSVTNTREHGNMVVLDHGNGWTTTYSQLQDGVLVKTGDVVNSGQAIGGVGTPSLYYVLLGNHLGFSVAQGDSRLDPKTILE